MEDLYNDEYDRLMNECESLPHTLSNYRYCCNSILNNTEFCREKSNDVFNDLIDIVTTSEGTLCLGKEDVRDSNYCYMYCHDDNECNSNIYPDYEDRWCNEKCEIKEIGPIDGHPNSNQEHLEDV